MGWTGFAVNVLLGCLYSPLTQARIVRVAGVPLSDQARVRGILTEIRGIPAAQVSNQKVLSKIYENPRVKRAQWTLNLFGRGLLKVSMKRAVAKIEGPPQHLLLEDGTIVRALVGAPEGTPVLILSDAARRPSLGWAGEWEPVVMAQTASYLQESQPEVAWSLQMDAEGVISLRGGERTTIRLGSSDRLQEKLSKLNEMIKVDPEILNRASRIVLVAPQDPMIVEAP